MSRGRTFENASRMIWGEGVCARNVIAQPDVNGKRNSKAQPNACASGRKETIVSPGSRGMFFFAKTTFASRLRCGSITPLEKPVVPDV